VAPCVPPERRTNSRCPQDAAAGQDKISSVSLRTECLETMSCFKIQDFLPCFGLKSLFLFLLPTAAMRVQMVADPGVSDIIEESVYLYKYVSIVVNY